MAEADADVDADGANVVRLGCDVPVGEFAAPRTKGMLIGCGA